MTPPPAVTRADFARLYDQHVDLVRSVLIRLCPAAHERLDDLTHEVFLRAWRGQATFRGQSSHKTWLCRIARNLAIDELRARKDPAFGASEAHAEIELLPAPGVDPSQRVAVLELLSALGADDRLLLVLLCVEQFSMAEISEALEVPVGTVKSRAFALRQRLKGNLERRGA